MQLTCIMNANEGDFSLVLVIIRMCMHGVYSLQDLSCLELSQLGLKFCTTPTCPVCFQRSEENVEITSCTYDAIRIVRDKKSDSTILNGKLHCFSVA